MVTWPLLVTRMILTAISKNHTNTSAWAEVSVPDARPHANGDSRRVRERGAVGVGVRRHPRRGSPFRSRAARGGAFADRQRRARADRRRAAGAVARSPRSSDDRAL